MHTYVQTCTAHDHVHMCQYITEIVTWISVNMCICDDDMYHALNYIYVNVHIYLNMTVFGPSIYVKIYIYTYE